MAGDTDIWFVHERFEQLRLLLERWGWEIVERGDLSAWDEGCSRDPVMGVVRVRGSRVWPHGGRVTFTAKEWWGRPPFRAMSGEQLRTLFWPEGSPQTRARLARHGLARLASLAVLAPLARRVGGVRSGSAGRCFAVGLAGQRLLATEASTRRVRHPYTPGERFLAHTLAVAQLYVELVESGAEVLAYDAEPDCWRPYLAAYGARAVCKPDAYVKLGVGEYEYSWLVERDMATESLGTVERQARRHLAYYHSGVERRTRGVTPRVAWIVPDTHRAEAVQTALDRLPAEAGKLFAVVTSADAVTLLTAEAGS